MGRVGAIQLAINPQTAEELRDGTQMPSDKIVPMYGGGIKGGAASIEGMRPGAYTVCAMLGDPRVASSVKLKCTPVKVTGAAAPDRVSGHSRRVARRSVTAPWR